MRKYKAILLTLIITLVAIIGFIIYNNYFRKWNEAEKYIDKYMTYQVVSGDDIERITKETYTKENYDGYFINHFTKIIQVMNTNIFIVVIIMHYM
ncbi:hypothetical protein VSK93_11525 [Clostridioides difficile]|uniref:DUF3139 domain-containing protein n=1 Tax=Clostridioides difficile TaxID=1496 RepID=UPI0030803B72